MGTSVDSGEITTTMTCCNKETGAGKKHQQRTRGIWLCASGGAWTHSNVATTVSVMEVVLCIDFSVYMYAHVGLKVLLNYSFLL